jgi:hypothetical protein
MLPSKAFLKVGPGGKTDPFEKVSSFEDIPYHVEKSADSCLSMMKTRRDRIAKHIRSGKQVLPNTKVPKIVLTALNPEDAACFPRCSISEDGIK